MKKDIKANAIPHGKCVVYPLPMEPSREPGELARTIIRELCPGIALIADVIQWLSNKPAK